MTSIHRYYRIAAAAEHFGIPYMTLWSAVQRGDIAAEYTACGLPLVTSAAVQRFVRHRPKPGRKPSKP